MNKTKNEQKQAMYRKDANLSEWLFAKFTVEGFDSSVRTDVSFQIERIVESFAAARAVVLFVGCVWL